jgi:transposase
LTAALSPYRDNIKLVGIEACPLSEWLYGALIENGFSTVCIETRHTQRFLSSRPNKADRSDVRGVAEMMRLGHFRPLHMKSKASQFIRTVLGDRQKFTDHMIAEICYMIYDNVVWRPP